MALNPKLSTQAANAAADAVCALANGGFLDIYDGTQPATANTAITSQTKLAGLTLAATAFGAAVAGVATANAVGSDTSADATGTASWFRVWKSDHTTPVFDGTVGTSGTDMIVATASFVAAAVISCSAFTYTQPRS